MACSEAKSRVPSFLFITGLYGLALAAAALTYRALQSLPTLPALLAADVAATLVVWLAGVAVRNSSVYDPYWSVAPAVIAAFYAAEKGALAAADLMFLAALALWSIRLTWNWARRFGGLGHEDWRYMRFRGQRKGLWFFANLFGIHLMPTVLVFFGMVPVREGLASAAPVNLVTGAGLALCAFAVWLETAADRQMDAHRMSPQRVVMDRGLWGWCRHPNYLGEMLFWWGLWLMQVSLRPLYWTAAGAAAITALFVFVSVPMMERHLGERRPEYADYCKRVPMLLPRPGRISRENAVPPAG